MLKNIFRVNKSNIFYSAVSLSVDRQLVSALSEVPSS
jgi:hypothetical protein